MKQRSGGTVSMRNDQGVVHTRAWSYMKAVEDAAQRAAATAKRGKNMVEKRQVYTSKFMARIAIFFQLSDEMREGRRGRPFH